jgi:hypothetical protein
VAKTGFAQQFTSTKLGAVYARTDSLTVERVKAALTVNIQWPLAFLR